MSQATPPPVQAELLADGAVVRLLAHGVMLNQLPASPLEGGPANLWLREWQGDAVSRSVPLLGPQSPLQPCQLEPGRGIAWAARGHWQGVTVQLQLRLSQQAAAWFWHLQLDCDDAVPRQLDLVHTMDVGLAELGTLRLNEYYVSHYIDLQPLQNPQHGVMVAARQNQPVAGRHPWLLLGCSARALHFATDALQWYGSAHRAGLPPAALAGDLPSQRLQHEHTMIALQTERLPVGPGRPAALAFFGTALAHHAEASGAADLLQADAALALDAAQPAPWPLHLAAPPPRGLFAQAPWLATQDLGDTELATLFGQARRHAEHGSDGRLHSFFHGEASHVVLRAKELAVLRPHGHLLRSGRALVPDETALVSTVWMAGVFHSMVCQGHVGINRFLTTVRGAYGQQRGSGLRLFVAAGGGWQQLGLPSAFEMQPERCRWLYRHEGGLIEVISAVEHAPQRLTLQLRVLEGPALRLRATLALALAGDEGLPGTAPVPMRAEGDGVFLAPAAGSALAERFPAGGFVVRPQPGQRFGRWGGDELLLDDGQPRGGPWLVLEAEAAPSFGLVIEGRLLPDAALAPEPLPALRWQVPTGSPLAAAAGQLGEIVPWLQHNALVHFLAPRGLEQFSGGGWGTRDVCQGPLEMLLAQGLVAPARALLTEVFSAQNSDGDWPQWFMFFERERAIRAGDSHGDIVFWPLVGLARYLLASGDAALLDQPLPFFDADPLPLWQHVERALQVIAARHIEGTALVAYGHGDWNDSLQPADSRLREHLCSSWTVTLHHQMLRLLGSALQRVGRGTLAEPLLAEAGRVRQAFARHLMPGGQIAGYVLFEPGRPPEPLLHPQDRRTGLRASLLPLMHAVLEDLVDAPTAQAIAERIEHELVGPDGARLFDRPLPYRGGPMHLFQRGESAAYFGREIGVMYMHAHLRWAEMLAHLGLAERFFEALQLAHPVALASRLPQATPRQSNCYFSSSDAAFADRAQAERDYARMLRGEVPLHGGWRVYSSGPGIALALVAERFIGLRREHTHWVFDPVLPQALRGLRSPVWLDGRELVLELQPGPRGRGPQRLVLEGTELPFTRRANPYRTGAAAVPLAALRALLPATGSPVLQVCTE